MSEAKYTDGEAEAAGELLFMIADVITKVEDLAAVTKEMAERYVAVLKITTANAMESESQSKEPNP